jgi:heptose I phosphotransferase
LSLGNFLKRLTRGTTRTWVSDDFRAALPLDLDTTVMDLQSDDRYHAKQGRSTARVRFDSPWGELAVYLKRHERLPIGMRLAALVDPDGHHSPAAAEWTHLNEARRLGIPVPDPVAAGEQIGPWGRLRSYLLVAELNGARELNEVLPELQRAMPPDRFDRLKRELAAELAALAARLHRAHHFHKDFYLCHVFLDPSLQDPAGRRLTLIDLHRLGRHRWTVPRWRWKDLGQLLYSTFDVDAINDRDRLRFWTHYRRATGLNWPRWQATIIRAKAARYRAHNR